MKIKEDNSDLLDDIDALYAEHVINKPIPKPSPSTSLTHSICETVTPISFASETTPPELTPHAGTYRRYFIELFFVAVNWALSIFYIGTVLINSWFTFGVVEMSNNTTFDGHFYAGQKFGLWNMVDFNEDRTRVVKLWFGSKPTSEGFKRYVV